MRRNLRRAITAALCAALLAAAHAEGLSVGARAPGFTLKTLAGKPYRLSDYKGKSVVILDFGRFTCLPCRDMLKDLQKLQAKYQGQGVRIFQVNLDGPLAGRVVPKGLRELGVTFPILQDAEFRVAEAYKVQTIPHLVLVDTQGRVRFTHTGYEPGLRAKLVAQVDKYRPK